LKTAKPFEWGSRIFTAYFHFVAYYHRNRKYKNRWLCDHTQRSNFIHIPEGPLSWWKVASLLQHIPWNIWIKGPLKVYLHITFSGSNKISDP
jgi:hypothetical protein